MLTYHMELPFHKLAINFFIWYYFVYEDPEYVNVVYINVPEELGFNINAVIDHYINELIFTVNQLKSKQNYKCFEYFAHKCIYLN